MSYYFNDHFRIKISLFIIYVFVCTLFTVIKCDAKQINNAERIKDQSPYVYKESVQYRCNEGYKMQGSNTTTCKVNGWNPPPPECIGIESHCKLHCSNYSRIVIELYEPTCYLSALRYEMSTKSNFFSFTISHSNIVFRNKS